MYNIFSDSILFGVVQLCLILFSAYAFLKQFKRSGIGLVAERGTETMRWFYGAYGAATAIFIALDVSVEVAKNHKVFFVLLDVALVAYICLVNPWFRNLLLGWTSRLKKERH